MGTILKILVVLFFFFGFESFALNGEYRLESTQDCDSTLKHGKYQRYPVPIPGFGFDVELNRRFSVEVQKGEEVDILVIQNSGSIWEWPIKNLRSYNTKVEYIDGVISGRSRGLKLLCHDANLQIPLPCFQRWKENWSIQQDEDGNLEVTWKYFRNFDKPQRSEGTCVYRKIIRK